MPDRVFHYTLYPPLLFIFLFIALLLPPPYLDAAEVSLAWDPCNPEPDEYCLYQRAQGQDYDYSRPVWTGPETTGTIDQLIEGTVYYFVVRAKVGDQESANSNEVSYTPPASSPTTYAITTSLTGGGIVSPNGTIILKGGSDQTFSISPSEGFRIVDVVADGVSKGAVSSYTFHQVDANHTLTAEFAANTYTILASAGPNGGITPSGNTTLNHGGSQEYTITPAQGYSIAGVTIDGTAAGPIAVYRFDKITGDHTIRATFIADTFSISATTGSNGTILPRGKINVPSGTNQVFTISPNDGYTIDNVTVDGVSIGNSSSYTFSNVTADHTIEACFTSTNSPPTADAGPDQTIHAEETVTLNGLNSIDPDDGIASFYWCQVAGDPVNVNMPEEGETTFIAPNVDNDGTALVFELTVTDEQGATSVDECIVNVIRVNLPPIADAGLDQIVDEGVQVSLDAVDSNDPDDGIVSFSWKQLSGPEVNLTDGTSKGPAFHAPDIGPEGASMAFEVTVTDAGGLQDTDTCMVSVKSVNIPPLADAGLDQQVKSGVRVTLDGSLSTDTAEDQIVSFLWHQTAGTPVTFSDSTAEKPTFMAPDASSEGVILEFRLTVADSEGLQDMDTSQVVVEAPATDATAPSVVIENPAPNVITVYRFDVDLSGIAWGDQGVQTVRWENSRGGNGVARGTSAWMIENIPLKYGTNAITVTATDPSGNSTTAWKIVFVKFKWQWW